MVVHHPKDVVHPVHLTVPLNPDPRHKLRVLKVITLEAAEDPVGVVHLVEVVAEGEEEATLAQVEVAEVHHLPVGVVENISADHKELHRKVVIKSRPEDHTVEGVAVDLVGEVVVLTDQNPHMAVVGVVHQVGVVEVVDTINKVLVEVGQGDNMGVHSEQEDPEDFPQEVGALPHPLIVDLPTHDNANNLI